MNEELGAITINLKCYGITSYFDLQLIIQIIILIKSNKLFTHFTKKNCLYSVQLKLETAVMY